jgi:hypothetical protein
MKGIKCENCESYRGMNCPNSKLCYDRVDKPFYRKKKVKLQPKKFKLEAFLSK